MGRKVILKDSFSMLLSLVYSRNVSGKLWEPEDGSYWSLHFKGIDVREMEEVG